MRLISFAMTQESFLSGRKTVTRRTTWENLKPGTRLMGVDRCMGFKKGEHPKNLGELEVLSVRRERLDAITLADVLAEGVAGCVTPEDFIARFAKAMRIRPSDLVTRIEFRRVDVACGECALCDRIRFLVWRARLEEGQAFEPGAALAVRIQGHTLGSALDEESARFALIEEIHRDRKKRHPLGIAQSLSRVIDALHVEDDADAIRDLEALAEDERVSVEMNGERNLECCEASSKFLQVGER